MSARLVLGEQVLGLVPVRNRMATAIRGWDRRPTYHRLIKSGELKPGYACDNDAGIYFADNEVKRVVHTREDAKSYHVSLQGGEIVEKELKAEMIE